MIDTVEQSKYHGSARYKSVCPVCKYSLKDLQEDQPCPECGTEIDQSLITSPEMQDVVAVLRLWCFFGSAGWGIFAFMYWVSSMLMLSVMNSYYPGSYDTNHFAGVWMRTAFVIAPLSLSISWHWNARRVLYLRALQAKEKQNKRTKVPKRVWLTNLPGILLGILGLMGALMLLSAM